MRHRRPDGSVWVRTFPLTLPRDHIQPRHTHEWDQLTYAASGVIQIETDEGGWVVPPHRAVWVPAGVAHAERMFAPGSVRMLCLAEGIADRLPRDGRMVNVSNLLRELVLHGSRIGSLDWRTEPHAHVIGVVLDQLSALSAVPLPLPMPRDPRAARVAARLREQPDDTASLAALAGHAGASRRTIERSFARETHMSAGEWRRRARLLHAVRRRREGARGTHGA